MIFCKRCGRYSGDSSANCEACGADLKAAGHSSFQGGAVRVGVSKSVASSGAAAATALAVAPASDTEAPRSLPSVSEGNPLFDRDKFLLRQKAIAINEKYYVTDEQGNPIVFVERPAMLTRQLIMVGAVAAAFLGGTFVVSFISGFFGTLLGTTLNAVVSLGGFVLVLALTAFTFVALIPRRHVTFYADDTKTQKLLEVKQLNKIEFPYANFTILDENGNVLGSLRKNVLFDYVRRRWYCKNAYGLQLLIAKEDSIILSLLRRTVPILQFLRTNFIFLRGEDVIGEFNRKMTILDRYVLDMSADPQRSVDRRIALALGVMLDTGERR